MSYMDELRERFVAAEQRFGRINEAGREYRDRLMGLMSRVEEEIRCRRDVEQQQAKEIARLSGEIDQISGENEQLRTMMMSLLTAVETGDTDSLGGTLNDMDKKIAVLIGEGQGSTLMSNTASEINSEFDDVADSVPVDDPGALEGAVVEEPEAKVAVPAPSFPLGEMMKPPGKKPADSEAAVQINPSAGSAGLGSDMAAYYGEEGQAEDDSVPTYSHAVAGWEDFLDDDEGQAATTGDNEPLAAAGHVAGGPADHEAGSIHDLIGRVKTVVDAEDSQQAASLEVSDHDADNKDDNGGKAVA